MGRSGIRGKLLLKGTGSFTQLWTPFHCFGRIVGTIWIKGSGEVMEGVCGRNRSSGIDWRRDDEASIIIAMDALYRYDRLQQVTSCKRGNLAPGSGLPYTGVNNQKQGEDFTYDQTGNCPRSSRTLRHPDSSSGIRKVKASRTPAQWRGDVSDNPNITQSRTPDVKNQITSITGPSGVIQPDYDNAGNTTLAPSHGSWTVGYAYKWDAWNRLVEIRQGATDGKGIETAGMLKIKGFARYYPNLSHETMVFGSIETPGGGEFGAIGWTNDRSSNDTRAADGQWAGPKNPGWLAAGATHSLPYEYEMTLSWDCCQQTNPSLLASKKGVAK
jgi:hypothetical protein